MASSRSAQQRWLRDVFCSGAVSAATQHNPIYAGDNDSASRAPLRRAMRAELDRLAPMYAKEVSHAEHLATIEKLATRLSRQHRTLLKDGRFRIGTAQKLLNVFLKLMWCAEQIPTPPHCPFDRIIIQLLPVQVRHISWTQLDSVDNYERLVQAARVKARGLPLAVWELEAYNAGSTAADRAI